MLLDIVVRRSSTTNADVDMVGIQELSSQLLKTLGEGSREEEITMIAILVGIC
jgi:hypothetical protein